jgi:hypothetical protein
MVDIAERVISSLSECHSERVISSLSECHSERVISSLSECHSENFICDPLFSKALKYLYC